MADFFDVKNYAEFLMNLSPNEITLISASIGVILSQNLTANQAQALGNAFELIGQALLTYGSQKQLLDDLDD